MNGPSRPPITLVVLGRDVPTPSIDPTWRSYGAFRMPSFY
jgi:hypothetical protein